MMPPCSLQLCFPILGHYCTFAYPGFVSMYDSCCNSYCPSDCFFLLSVVKRGTASVSTMWPSSLHFAFMTAIMDVYYCGFAVFYSLSVCQCPVQDVHSFHLPSQETGFFLLCCLYTLLCSLVQT